MPSVQQHGPTRHFANAKRPLAVRLPGPSTRCRVATDPRSQAGVTGARSKAARSSRTGCGCLQRRHHCPRRIKSKKHTVNPELQKSERWRIAASYVNAKNVAQRHLLLAEVRSSATVRTQFCMYARLPLRHWRCKKDCQLAMQKCRDGCGCKNNGVTPGTCW